MDAMCRNFQYELQKRKIEWYPTLELASMELVAEYAAQGFGGAWISLASSLPRERESCPWLILPS